PEPKGVVTDGRESIAFGAVRHVEDRVLVPAQSSDPIATGKVVAPCEVPVFPCEDFWTHEQVLALPRITSRELIDQRERRVHLAEPGNLSLLFRLLFSLPGTLLPGQGFFLPSFPPYIGFQSLVPRDPRHARNGCEEEGEGGAMRSRSCRL